MVVYNGTGRLKKVLLCPPKYFFEAAPINEIAKQHQDGLDNSKMLEEFQRLVEAYEKSGVEVVLAEPTSEIPEAIFTRDFGGHVSEGYILGNFATSIRFKERAFYENVMATLGIKKIAEVRQGFFEGGDFTFIDERTLAVGLLERSNEQGLMELKEQLEPLGYHIHGVKGKAKYLHLDMCFNMVSKNLALGYKDGLPLSFLELLSDKGIGLISGDETMIFKHAYNVQALGDNRVLSLKQNTVINKAMTLHGLKVVEVEISEILKAGGGIHCMSFPLEREK